VQDPGKRRTMLTLGGVFLGLGVGGLALGGVSTFLAVRAAGDYNQTFRIKDKNTAKLWTGFMWGGFGAGLGLVVIGAVLLGAAPDKTRPQTNTAMVVRPIFSDQALGLSIAGRW
jgi:hypothetical protein